jgi:epoxyqueuosine reductase
VLEKAWAQRAGLGWIGKNANLLHPRHGSFFFLGELIVDLPLPADPPFSQDHCGSCTRCIDACPTDAIYRPGAVDANRCISYWTIEHRGPEFPEDLAPLFGDWVFGCDVCQDVCPWTRFGRPTPDVRFLPRDDTAHLDLDRWAELDLESYRSRFRRSPLKRPKYEGLMRNVANARRNQRANREGDE